MQNKIAKPNALFENVETRKCQISTSDTQANIYIHSLFFPFLRHVKALEQRSQLLDAALASADEANRRWEECRALVDQLRVENAALRAALNAAHATVPPPPPPQPPASEQTGESVENGTRQDSRAGSIDRDTKE